MLMGTGDVKEVRPWWWWLLKIIAAVWEVMKGERV